MDKILKVFNSEMRGIDEQEQTMTAYISTGVRDRMDEVMDPEGLDRSNFNNNPVVLWAHQCDKPPIGKAMWIKREGDGILSKVKFAKTKFAQEIFQLYKDGFLRAFSVGFLPKEWVDGDGGEKEPRRIYKKWELLEYSAVPVPANPEALSLAMQKGVLKNADIIKAMEDLLDSQVLDNTKSVIVPPVIVPPAESLEDEIAEIKLLQEKNAYLEKENQDLKYKLYHIYNHNKQPIPEITVDVLAKKIVEGVDGVIRKLQGRIS